MFIGVYLGGGKTFAAHEFAKANDWQLYMVPSPNNGSLFFDGYVGQEVVVFDDFYGWIRYHDLLKYCDSYAIKVNIKGAMVNWCPKHVFLTSNVDWRQWYEWTAERKPGALQRRIDEEREYIRPWDYEGEDPIYLQHK